MYSIQIGSPKTAALSTLAAMSAEQAQVAQAKTSFADEEVQMLAAAVQRTHDTLKQAGPDDLVSIHLSGNVAMLNGRMTITEHFYVGIQRVGKSAV